MQKSIVITTLFIAVISQAWSADFDLLPPAGNWNRVGRLDKGAPIQVELGHGDVVEGIFVRVEERAIFMDALGGERFFPKGTIKRIKLMRPGSRARRAGIAGGITFGIGFGLGYAAVPQIADQGKMDSGERIAAAATIGALIGGAAAAISLASRPSPRAEVIYWSR